MVRVRQSLCKLILGVALAIAGIVQGCGRLGYDSLVTEFGDASASTGGSDGAALTEVGLPGDLDDGGQGDDARNDDGSLGTDTNAMPSRGSIVSGQYLGTGTAGLKVTGLGFAPDVVFVHARLPSSSLFASRLMPAGQTRMLSDFNASTTTDIVTGFEADGFELGTKAANAMGVVGDYVALKATPGSIAVGRFEGNEQPRSFTGVGFTPGYVFIVCERRPPVHRSRTMDTTLALRGNSGPNRITSFDVDGFSLGSEPDVNESGADCQWFAVREAVGVMAATMFIGDQVEPKLVPMPGGLPQAVFIQCDAVTGQQWVWKPVSLGADTDASYTLGNGGVQTNMVQRMLSGGFELGSDARVNVQNTPCHAVAFGG